MGTSKVCSFQLGRALKCISPVSEVSNQYYFTVVTTLLSQMLDCVHFRAPFNVCVYTTNTSALYRRVYMYITPRYAR